MSDESWGHEEWGHAMMVMTGLFEVVIYLAVYLVIV